ncbi:RDD family protein [Sinomonas sp. ASV322]|uniref:RDD family protein n=1 Tax=Sinomonas sp. ASV322 TaxID=3041920 RepID=UPI0027DD4DFE|nr:RDD family protein [Sinomonas sp. ASV322]MDQ4500833.1 RDD family protein [Sinomonas sp. ASV322]
MIDRKDIGSWLSGPPTEPGYYPGRALGLPRTGPGSVARLGRRVAALCIDWAACLLISAAFFQSDSIATLAVFAAEQMALVGTVGFGLGHRILGIKVVRLGGGPAGIPAAIIRALLLCLVIPAVVFDADQRGLHDKVAKTVLVRM